MTPIHGPRWTIAAATAVAVTIGGTGFAIANSGSSDSSLPDPISLRDRAPVEATVESARSLVRMTSAPVLQQNADGTFSLVNASDSLSSDSLSSDSLSGDSLSSDSLSSDSLSGDSISGDSISGDSLSSDSISISDSLDSSDSTS